MAILEMFSWWYAQGWSVFLQKIKSLVLNITDFFSMSDLVRTLFQPFRQISAASSPAESSLDLKFHMFIDRLVSRIVGFLSRLILLFAGTFIILCCTILSLLLLLLWPFIPFAPIAGIILFMTGVTL